MEFSLNITVAVQKKWFPLADILSRHTVYSWFGTYMYMLFFINFSFRQNCKELWIKSWIQLGNKITLPNKLKYVIFTFFVKSIKVTIILNIFFTILLFITIIYQSFYWSK